MANPLMFAALGYEAQGLSVIPIVPKGKIPLIPSWSEYQETRATREQIGQWWSTWPKANVGIVTGKVSSIFVVDLDNYEAATAIKETLGPLANVGLAQTGKGFHVFYRHNGQNYPNKAGVRPHVDFRGDGGYVVAPPSIHESGKVYHWVKHLKIDKLPLLPDAFIEIMQKAHEGLKERFNTAAALAGVPEGQRDYCLFRLAAKLRGADVPYEIAIDLCEQAAANCTPPFIETKKKVDQAYKYPAGHTNGQQGSFFPEIITAKQLLETPVEEAHWVWDQCLPLGATSALIGKSYVGKSTFAASLSLAVSRGIEFLGRTTTKGAVLYVYLDGPLQEMRDNFLKIGLNEYDQVYFHIGRKPDNVIEWVKEQCLKYFIRLVIIDTAQKFFGFTEDSYEVKINAMQPMLDLVNEFNFHAMFTYHAAKNSADSVSALGSVAAEANARVSLYLRKMGHTDQRIFDTEQNSGKKFQSIGLSDPTLGFLTKTGTLQEVQMELVKPAINDFVLATPGCTQKDIMSHIEGNKEIISRAIGEMKTNGQLEWRLEGRKHRLYVAGTLDGPVIEDSE